MPDPGPHLKALPLAAVLFLTAGLAVFAVGDAIAKLLVQDLPALQVNWGRFAFMVPCLALVVHPRRWPALAQSAVPRQQLIRSLLPVLSSFFFVLGVAAVPLADAAAILFTSPFFVLVLSVFFLGERVGAHRWASVVVGFLGMLIILQPGAGSVSPGGWFVVAAAATFAGFQILTRRIGSRDTTLQMVVWVTVLGAAAMSAIVPFVWVTPDAGEWLLLIASGVISAIGHGCFAIAFVRAQASAIAPLVYTQLIWATLLGFLLFGDLPGLLTLVGAMIIVGAGLYVIWRENYA